MMDRESLSALLEDAYDRYNRPEFIEEDPVGIPHLFDKKEDIEISGFLTALIAWGRRAMIIRNAQDLIDRMDRAPFDFVMQASADELARLDGFVHRTLNGVDARTLVLALRRVYGEAGGLEAIFARALQPADQDVFAALCGARAQLLALPGFPARTHKHIANPASGSSAKRINMYLRWMVRRDRRGVDFGIWQGIPMRQLICPLDVHTGNVARKLGLLTRKQNDWKAAAELTAALRTFCPEDPVRYDFSLFGLGAYGEI